jgi:type VI secretion system secreted protein VgrG
MEEAMWAVSLQGKEGIGELYEFTVGFKSEDADIDCQALLGEACGIELEAQKGIKRYFSGQIVRFSAQGKRGKHWYYEALLAPKLWHASRRSDFKIWQNKTIQEICDEVLGNNAIHYEWRLKNSYKSWEYLVQYNESDLDFINRRLQDEGIFYWFEHTQSGEKLILGDHFSTHEPFGGYESIPFYPPDEAVADEDHYWDWHMAREPETGKYAHKDYDFKRPSTDLSTEYADPRGHLFDQYETYAYPGNYVEKEDGANYATARLEALQQRQDSIILKGRVRGAIPGYRFTLRRHPRKDQNRELIITKATYRVGNNAYEAAGAAEQSEFEVSIEAMPADRAFKAPQRTPKPRTQGPQTAVVVGPEAEEIYTDEYGRVKVHFHWDRYGKRDGSDSCWIRVASPWAGSSYGGIHIPRIGQEVIVDHEYGDPDRPIITGRVYNAEQMPPWKLPANKTQSGFLTRSSKGGGAGEGLRDGAGEANALRFEDARGQEQLWLHAQKDQLTEVENDEDKWVGNDRRKTVDGNESNVIHKNRTETVDLDEKITVHQNRTERVDLSEEMDIGINQSFTVGAKRSKKVGVKEDDTIGKTWNISVGSLKSESIGVGYMQNVGVFKMVNLGVAYNLNVGMVMMSNVGLMRMDNVGMDHTQTVGKNYSQTVGSNDTHKVGEKYELTVGGNASITVDEKSITFKVGSSVMVMKDDGNVLINGSTFDFSASGPVQINGKDVDVN